MLYPGPLEVVLIPLDRMISYISTYPVCNAFINFSSPSLWAFTFPAFRHWNRLKNQTHLKNFPHKDTSPARIPLWKFTQFVWGTSACHVWSSFSDAFVMCPLLQVPWRHTTRKGRPTGGLQTFTFTTNADLIGRWWGTWRVEKIKKTKSKCEADSRKCEDVKWNLVLVILTEVLLVNPFFILKLMIRNISTSPWTSPVPVSEAPEPGFMKVLKQFEMSWSKGTCLLHLVTSFLHICFTYFSDIRSR